MKYIARAALFFIAFGLVAAHPYGDAQKTAGPGANRICSFSSRVSANSGIIMEAATDYRPQ